MLGESTQNNAMFLKIIGGRIAQKVEATTEGAEKRVYQDDDGTDVTVYDKYYDFVKGYITGLIVTDGKFGAQLTVTIFDKGEEYKIGFGENTNYFTSFCEKIPNIDTKKEVTITSWDFIPKDAKIGSNGKAKSKKGITIIQDGEKVKKAYYNPETGETLLGMPTVSKEESKTYGTDDWKIHFMQVKKFYKKEIERLSSVFTLSNVPETERGAGYDKSQTTLEVKTTKPTIEEEISIEDIPF